MLDRFKRFKKHISSDDVQMHQREWLIKEWIAPLVAYVHQLAKPQSTQIAKLLDYHMNSLKQMFQEDQEMREEVERIKKKAII